MERLGDGPIQPYDQGDGIDVLVVTAREGAHFGHFAFPAEVLSRHGVLASAAGAGKRAFRVYPPWSVTSSAQAARTATWQRPHFLVMDGVIDPQRAHDLYPHQRPLTPP